MYIVWLSVAGEQRIQELQETTTTINIERRQIPERQDRTSAQDYNKINFRGELYNKFFPGGKNRGGTEGWKLPGGNGPSTLVKTFQAKSKCRVFMGYCGVMKNIAEQCGGIFISDIYKIFEDNVLNNFN